MLGGGEQLSNSGRKRATEKRSQKWLAHPVQFAHTPHEWLRKLQKKDSWFNHALTANGARESLQ